MVRRKNRQRRAVSDEVPVGDSISNRNNKEGHKKRLFSRIKPVKNNSNNRQETNTDEQREPAPTLSTTESHSRSSLWSRRKQLNSGDVLSQDEDEDEAVEIVLDDAPKKKHSFWHPKQSKEEDQNVHHRLPNGEDSTAATGEATVSAPEEKEEEEDSTAAFCHVSLVPSMLSGLVATAKAVTTSPSSACYVRIISPDELVGDSVVKSLPLLLESKGLQDKRKGGKNVVVLWPNNSTASFTTTAAALDDAKGVDLEVGVVSNEEHIPLGSSTLHLDSTETHGEQRLVKIDVHNKGQAPKRLGRLFRSGKNTIGLFLDDKAVINVMVDVKRSDTAILSTTTTPLLNRILTSFSDQKQEVVDNSSVPPSPIFSCCSPRDGFEYEVDAGCNGAEGVDVDGESVEQDDGAEDGNVEVAEEREITTDKENGDGGDYDNDASCTKQGSTGGEEWSVTPSAAEHAAAASGIVCSVFSCCFAHSADESRYEASLPALPDGESPSTSNQKDEKSLEPDGTRDFMDKLDAIGTPVSIEDHSTLPEQAINTGMEATVLANTVLCSPYCNDHGSAALQETTTSGTETDTKETDSQEMSTTNKQHSTSHSFSVQESASIPAELTYESASSSLSPQKGRNVASSRASSWCEARDDDSVHAVVHGVSPRNSHKTMQKMVAPAVESKISSSELSKPTTSIANAEVDDAAPDAGPSFCTTCCGEEDVDQLRLHTSSIQESKTDPKSLRLQRDFAGLCMTCLGDEDVADLRPAATKLSTVSESTRVTSKAPLNEAVFSSAAEVSMIPSAEATEDEETGVGGPSLHSLEVDYSSSYTEDEYESTDLAMSAATSLYSEDKQSGWVPFLGFGGKKGGESDEGGESDDSSATDYDDDEHSENFSSDSSDTASFS